MATTDWLVGSYPSLPAQSVTINGGAQAIATGDYYLFDDTGSLSLLSRMVAAMTAGGVGSAAAYVNKNRRVVLSGSGTFTVSWPADLVLRNLFGFSGSLSGASSYTATNISRLLWSGGRTASPRNGVLGSSGARVYQAYGTDAPERPHVVHLSEWREQVLDWSHVVSSRYQSTSELGGEYLEFFDEVLIRGYRLKHYRSIDEDGSSATAGASGGLGPYVLDMGRAGQQRAPFGREASMGTVDAAHPVSVPLRTVPEYAT